MCASDVIGTKKQTTNVKQATDNVIMLLKILSVPNPPAQGHTFIRLFIHPSIQSMNTRGNQRKGEENCFLSSVIKLLTVSPQGEGTQKPLPQALSLW